MRSRITAISLVLMLAAGMMATVPARAGHNSDERTKNFRQLALEKIKLGKGVDGQGSGLAFKDDLVIAGA